MTAHPVPLEADSSSWLVWANVVRVAGVVLTLGSFIAYVAHPPFYDPSYNDGFFSRVASGLTVLTAISLLIFTVSPKR